MDKQQFLNRLRSLWNIDRHKLPELRDEDWPQFRDNAPHYFAHADKEQGDAIWREVEKRQRPEPVPMADDINAELLAALRSLKYQMAKHHPDADEAIIAAMDIAHKAISRAEAHTAAPDPVRVALERVAEAAREYQARFKADKLLDAAGPWFALQSALSALDAARKRGE